MSIESSGANRDSPAVGPVITVEFYIEVKLSAIWKGRASTLCMCRVYKFTMYLFLYCIRFSLNLGGNFIHRCNGGVGGMGKLLKRAWR